jgi:hypothetical protein
MTKKSKAHRPFEITPEFKERSQTLIEEYVDAMKLGSDKEKDSIEALFRLIQIEREKQESLYQPEPPNITCTHAVCKGLLIENAVREYERDSQGKLFHSATRFRDKNFHPGIIPLLETPFEKASIWTYDDSEKSLLLINVDTKVKQEKWWKTLASCLRIGFTYFSDFEKIPETNYNWIFHFDSLKPIDSQKFLDKDHLMAGTFNGFVETPDSFAELAPMLELLIRDDSFFTATQNLLTSFENHNFCMTCAIRLTDSPEHPNHEPELWEIAPFIPKMEVAIVQATRACEGLLGKPGKKKDRVLSRWKNKITLDPEDTFSVAGISYFDFYHILFDIRGDAAHNLGQFPYELSREITISAQVFSWKILQSYYDTHCLSLENALARINFNQDLLSPMFIENRLQ